MKMAKQSNRTMLKQADLFKLGDLLRQHCKTENGFAVYSEGKDDAEILKLMNEAHPDLRINHSNVAGLRKSLFGNLRSAPDKVTMQHLLDRIEALEAWAAARPVQGFKKQ
jgi:hypothetical protein